MNSIDCALEAYRILRDARPLLFDICAPAPVQADPPSCQLLARVDALLAEAPVKRALEGAT